MARKPRIKTPPVPALPTPTRCQYGGCPPSARPFASLTFRSASGLTWSEASCQSHMELRADQVRAEGGKLLSVRLLEREVTP